MGHCYSGISSVCCDYRHCSELSLSGLMDKMLEFVITNFFIVVSPMNFLFHWVAYFYFTGQLVLTPVAMESLSLLFQANMYLKDSLFK